VVVALADGHGAARHFRSEAGAEFAVEAATRVALRHTERLAAMTQPADVQAAALAEVAAEIVQDWFQAVARAVEKDPFSPDELAQMAWGGDSVEIPYGATLLTAVVAGRWLVCLQIGDGDVVVVHPDGSALLPIPVDPSLDGVRTTSLCQPDALESFREFVQDLEIQPVLAVLMVSDGYSNAQSADPWYPAVGADLARLLRHEGPEWVAERLPEWARRCASSEGSGDDTTMVLMVRRGAAPPVGSVSPSQARTVTESR
jgi:serine/threonine protein phosphatase PrpC